MISKLFFSSNMSVLLYKKDENELAFILAWEQCFDFHFIFERKDQKDMILFENQEKCTSLTDKKLLYGDHLLLGSEIRIFNMHCKNGSNYF